MTARVVDALQSAAMDRAAIERGVPSRALMRRAGTAAAAEITAAYGDRLGDGVILFAGPGNNGGDAWVTAGALAAAGIRVDVREALAPRTEDARAERDEALPLLTDDGAPRARIVVDGLLGTGASGAPRGAIAEAIVEIGELRRLGAIVVALDVPSGLDASTGDGDQSVVADLTLTFGAIKRGLLVARGRCGAIRVLDIGFGAESAAADAPLLVDAGWVRQRIPPIPADAHKGTRGKLAIIGGAGGMVGASVLAARAAFRSGIGMVRLVVATDSIPIVQSAEPHALAAAWPDDERAVRSLINEWADTVLIGPGLGATAGTRALVQRVLATWRGPVVLDADALNAFEGGVGSLAALLGDRPALITPHAAELARLLGTTTASVLSSRFEIGAACARSIGCAVLLKGVPTIVSDPAGTRLVSASGNPALAAAGSGDVLAGIAATLLAQTDSALESGACAAWIHGRAAELAVGDRAVRGVTISDVTEALGDAWNAEVPAARPPLLAELPAVREAS